MRLVVGKRLRSMGLSLVVPLSILLSSGCLLPKLWSRRQERSGRSCFFLASNLNEIGWCHRRLCNYLLIISLLFGMRSPSKRWSLRPRIPLFSWKSWVVLISRVALAARSDWTSILGCSKFTRSRSWRVRKFILENYFTCVFWLMTLVKARKLCSRLHSTM